MKLIHPNMTRPTDFEIAIAASNRDTLARRLALYGIGTFALLTTVVWGLFLAWIIWSTLLWVGDTFRPETKLPVGCFQSEINPGIPGQSACS